MNLNLLKPEPGLKNLRLLRPVAASKEKNGRKVVQARMIQKNDLKNEPGKTLMKPPTQGYLKCMRYDPF